MLKLKSKIGPKGQVVIPKPIRDALGFESGKEVYFHVRENEVILEKKSGEEILDEFVNEFKKRKLPKKINWDELYYSQFERR
ncbi:MAG: AbrB/MazE/SpoVT family DNA-binding domain-containing protein [Candidatus Altiarchaeales archaeon]|nr:AbrB/MazE/SpoVT family DNA-binding domain-containing protein [Candidatus Altiarchaeales archaeon]